MKPVRSIEPDEGIADIRKRFIRNDPQRQRKVKTSISELLGNAELAWGRGRQCGIHDAYLTLKQKYPKIAEELRKAYNMTKDGAFAIGRKVE